MRRLRWLAIWIAAGAGVAFAQCEVSAPVRKLLEKSEFRAKIVETAEQREARNAAFRKALDEFADNYFVLRAQLRGFDDRGEALEWARSERRAHPGHLVYEMIEAEALAGRDTPEAIRRLEALAASHPDEPRIPLEIAGTVDLGRFRDKARIQKEIDAYRKLCPESADGQYLSLVSQNGTQQQIAEAAGALRKRLEAQADGEFQRNSWEALWSLEFKAHPVAEHPAVRKRIAADLAKLEASPKGTDAAWLNFLKSGYQSAEDQVAVDRLVNEILKTHLQSNEAKRIVQERFRKEHPYPSTGNEKQKEDWRRIQLAAAREWHKQWPDDAMVLEQIFIALNELPETKPEQVAAAVDEFQSAYRKNPEFTTSPPLEFMIASAYVKQKIRLDEVPRMVEKGYQAAVARARRFADDRYDEQTQNKWRNSLDSIAVERGRILVDCYSVTKEVEKARAVLDGIKLSKPGNQKTGMLTLRAKVAELESRKADALVFFRAAMDTRTTTPAGKDALAEDMRRLWKDLGGTPEGYRMFMDKPKVAEATDSRWEKPKNPLPAFTLTDLNGKTWRLANLEGKALLINIWATWCSPCVAEHPELQKLYDKLKDRGDVSVLTFNVDEDLGKVAPYLAEHKYTFPVMPAKDVVDAVVPVLAIPRNWLVSPKGKLEWEQIGFGGDSKWEEAILAKLEEVTRK